MGETMTPEQVQQALESLVQPTEFRDRRQEIGLGLARHDKALRAELATERDWHTETLHAAESAEAELGAALAQVAALREALRKEVVDRVTDYGKVPPLPVWTCGHCKASWRDGEPELHEPTCPLAEGETVAVLELREKAHLGLLREALPLLSGGWHEPLERGVGACLGCRILAALEVTP